MDGKLLERVLEIVPDCVPDKPEHNPTLYYKTRTVRSGSLVEVECYPVYETEYRRKLEKVKPTTEAVRIVNDRNARKRFERLAECNFQPGRDCIMTLTYEGTAPEEEDRCRKDLRNFITRINRARKKLGLGKCRYMAVLETGKRGRLHHHLLISGGLDRDTMEQLWGHGYANCDRIRKTLGGLVTYMTKNFSGKRETGRHRYMYSRGLKQPTVTVSKTRISRRQAERIREDADQWGEAVLRRKYPGLALESLEIRQSDWLPGGYIYARLRRPTNAKPE